MSDEKVRVMRIFSRLNIGGPSIHVVLLSAGLDRERFETTLVIGREEDREGNFHDFAETKNVEPVVVPTLGREIRPFRDARSLFALCRLMVAHRPHVVHTHTAKAGALGRVAAWLTGVPVVVHTFHGSVFSGYFGGIGTRIYESAERLLSCITDAIIGISPAVTNELLIRRLRPRHDIHTIPLGLELDRFRDTSCSTSGGLRHALGLDDNTPLVGAVGRLAPIKDLPTLFRAIASLTGVHLAVVGDGPERARLEALSQTLGLASRVHFTGFLAELETVYPDLDCVANSSRNEGTPVALIEAMAAGVPVVATDVGGTHDLLAEGELGSLVRPGDPDALADAISAAIDSIDDARTARAREFVVEKYRAERLVRDTERLYRELLHLKGVAKAAPSLSTSRT